LKKSIVLPSSTPTSTVDRALQSGARVILVHQGPGLAPRIQAGAILVEADPHLPPTTALYLALSIAADQADEILVKQLRV